MNREPSPHRLPRAARAFVGAVGLWLAGVVLVAAQAAVSVEVRGPDGSHVDGRVTLTPSAGGEGRSCTTQRGDCRLAGVPGGRYVVTFQPASGEAPAPRNVMIPPSGTVTLRVSAR